MELKNVKRVMRSCAPVLYDGTEYERVTACIMRMDPVSGAEMYSLELLDYSGSAVVIVPMAAVEVSANLTPQALCLRRVENSI